MSKTFCKKIEEKKTFACHFFLWFFLNRVFGRFSFLCTAHGELKNTIKTYKTFSNKSDLGGREVGRSVLRFVGSFLSAP
jgi:hypothetical protein